MLGGYRHLANRRAARTVFYRFALLLASGMTVFGGCRISDRNIDTFSSSASFGVLVMAAR